MLNEMPRGDSVGQQSMAWLEDLAGKLSALREEFYSLFELFLENRRRIEALEEQRPTRKAGGRSSKRKKSRARVRASKRRAK